MSEILERVLQQQAQEAESPDDEPEEGDDEPEEEEDEKKKD
jgi:hypothetical protein